MSDSTMSGNNGGNRRRFVPLIWLGGVVAAALLVLGVNGTLSSWTTAIIHNDTNNAAVANAVRLTETGGANTCNSDDTGPGAQNGGNEYTCSTINKYGGTTSPLVPGGTQSVTVTMKNTGTETAASGLTLAPGACSSSGGTSPTPDLCAELQVAITCTTPSTLSYGPSTLTAFAATQTVVTTLAANASTSCTFTVSLPAAAPASYGGQTASQPLTWTLTA